MGLRAQAEADTREILENEDDFGWDITITNPSDLSANMVGFSTDVSYIIDPDTGLVVSGRTASVALPITSLVAAGFSSLPVGVADTAGKPWIIEFDDINGNPYVFKVAESHPDRAVGVVVCILEQYQK